MQQISTNPCDQEPIQFPGKIQPHGALIVADRQSGLVQLVSANINDYLPGEIASMPGQPLTELLSVTGFNPDLKVSDYQIVHSPQKGACYLVPHFTPQALLVELEPVLHYGYNPEEIIGHLLTDIMSSDRVLASLEEATRKIKQITGFNRVMVYKFHDDGHGEVIAEEVDPGVESYFGLHYPASDIPQQARALYKRNLVRLIADVSANDCALVGLPSTWDANQIDLSDASLRAVSPVHIQYLKNMGVAASFSVSIVSQGELWGLIACHHYQPKQLDYRQRLHSKMIGQLVSGSVRFQVEEEKLQLHQYWRENTAILVRQVRQQNSLAAGLTAETVNLLSINSASGAAICYQGKITTVGNAPKEDYIRELLGFLRNAGKQDVFRTNHLAKHFPPAAAQPLSSGILAVPISAEWQDGIIWFKPELEQQIKWAGNPEKSVILNPDGAVRIEPRTSFAVFIEALRHHSEKWTATECLIASKLREEVLLVIQEQLNHLQQLNEELKKAYEELDSFSYTISHDLKTPLSTIYSFAELLLEDDPSLDRHMLTEKILRNAERMQQLIKDVFKYTRLSREPITPQAINMADLLHQIREDLLDAYRDAKPDLEIGETPTIYGDTTMISQVFANLMGNAVKYSSKREKPKIQILGRAENNAVTYTIIDNGIGMDPSHTSKLFHLFYRTPDAKQFEGTGLGLAIVKRIIDKHHGELWFETEKNQGTRFYIRLKNQPMKEKTLS